MLLATGSFAAVYRVEGRVRKVALDGCFDSLQREACLLHTLPRHPNLVVLLGFGWCDGAPYIDLAYGGEALVDVSAVAPDVAFSQAAAGVAFLHSHGVAHLDVKLDNLVQDSTGAVRLIDLGLAENVSSRRELRSGARGSMSYCCPEMLCAPHRVNYIEADLWSLGIVAFALELGRIPWSAASVKDPRFCRFAESEQRFSAHMATLEQFQKAPLPPWLASACDALLRLVPSERSDAHRVVADLLAAPEAAEKKKACV